MSAKVFAISDLHFGHKKILEFSPTRTGSTVDEHDAWIISQWNSTVTKRDVVYVLGDVAFGAKALEKVSQLRGIKHLIRGNHDQLSTQTYLKYFNSVHGILKKGGYWLTHAPIHPIELRGKKNIHGHVHANTIQDERYINACVEACNGIPILLFTLGQEDS